MLTELAIATSLIAGALPVAELPGGHKLVQVRPGVFSVINSNNITVVDPSILAIGYDNQSIVACVKDEQEGRDTKRFFLVSLVNGVAIDTINKDNWEYFLRKLPGLGHITMVSLVNEQCP